MICCLIIRLNPSNHIWWCLILCGLNRKRSPILNKGHYSEFTSNLGNQHLYIPGGQSGLSLCYSIRLRMQPPHNRLALQTPIQMFGIRNNSLAIITRCFCAGDGKQCLKVDCRQAVSSFFRMKWQKIGTAEKKQTKIANNLKWAGSQVKSAIRYENVSTPHLILLKWSFVWPFFCIYA